MPSVGLSLRPASGTTKEQIIGETIFKICSMNGELHSVTLTFLTPI